MASDRPRITIDLSTNREVDFFSSLDPKKWPQLMRAILRDAIRERRAHYIKRVTLLDFSDDEPLNAEEHDVVPQSSSASAATDKHCLPRGADAKDARPAVAQAGPLQPEPKAEEKEPPKLTAREALLGFFGEKKPFAASGPSEGTSGDPSEIVDSINSQKASYAPAPELKPAIATVKTGLQIKGFFGNDLAHLRESPKDRGNS